MLRELGGNSPLYGTVGVKVLIADRIENTGGTVAPFKVDVTSYQTLNDMVKEAKNLWGGLNILVNNAYNAADAQQGGVLEVDEDR